MKNGKTPVILQVIPHLGAGGAEQGCIDIAAELVASGAEAIVVSNGGTRLHELQRAGATHIDLPVDSKNPFVMWQNIFRLRKLITKYEVDIVHARSRAPAWSALKACEGTAARFVTTCHAPYNIQNTAKKFYNSSIAKGERVIAISHYVADYLRANFGLGEDVIRIIHRGVPLDRFHPSLVTPERLVKLSREWRIPEGMNIVMLPGRLTRWKGQIEFIRALAQVVNEDAFGLILGDEQGRVEYKDELFALIEELGLESKVRIVEHCNDMPAAYMLSTVVVSASTEPEGFGRVPVEAQAMGRIAIATNHGGAMETIIPGHTGWLIPPSDPEALAQAITAALSLTKEQRDMMAAQAMAHVSQHFSKTVMADKTLNV
ncbi:MAG: glycosyltransferase family 4 protein [Pseudobdellovibrionaceae bacterium]